MTQIDTRIDDVLAVPAEAGPTDVVPYLRNLLDNAIIVSWDSFNVDVLTKRNGRMLKTGGLLRVVVQIIDEESTATRQIDFDDNHRHFAGVSEDMREYELMPQLGAPAIAKDEQLVSERTIMTDGQVFERPNQLHILSKNYQHQYIR